MSNVQRKRKVGFSDPYRDLGNEIVTQESRYVFVAFVRSRTRGTCNCWASTFLDIQYYDGCLYIVLNVLLEGLAKLIIYNMRMLELPKMVIV